jgi:DNA-binding Lrp family transcriptional regulator
MAEEVVRTGVDELLDLLGKNAKIPLVEAASKLKIDVGVVQAWVDFLVEEGIIGIEYKFTTPYIYINKGIEKEKTELHEEHLNVQYFKRQFWERARHDNIPEVEIGKLWEHHITQALELQKKYFYFEAQRRKLPRVEELWDEYKELIIVS